MELQTPANEFPPVEFDEDPDDISHLELKSLKVASCVAHPAGCCGCFWCTIIIMILFGVYIAFFPVCLSFNFSDFKVINSDISNNWYQRSLALDQRFSSLVKEGDDPQTSSRRRRRRMQETEKVHGYTIWEWEDFYYRAIAATSLSVFFYSKQTSNILTEELLGLCHDVEQGIKTYNGYHDHALIYKESNPEIKLLFNYSGDLYLEAAPGSFLNYVYPQTILGNYIFNGNGPTLTLEGDLEETIRKYRNIADLTEFFDFSFNFINVSSKYLAAVYPFGIKNKSESRDQLNNFVDSYVDNFFNKLPSSITNKIGVAYFDSRGTILENELYFYLGQDLNLAIWSLVIIYVVVYIYCRSFYITTLGLLGVCSSFIPCFAIYEMVWGESFNLVNMVSLWVILGIGCDDICVFISSYRRAPLESVDGQIIPNHLRLAFAYREAGAAMFVTSFTTSCSFFSLCLSTINPLPQFGWFLGSLVLTNFVLVMTWFPSILQSYVWMVMGFMKCGLHTTACNKWLAVAVPLPQHHDNKSMGRQQSVKVLKRSSIKSHGGYSPHSPHSPIPNDNSANINDDDHIGQSTPVYGRQSSKLFAVPGAAGSNGSLIDNKEHSARASAPSQLVRQLTRKLDKNKQNGGFEAETHFGDCTNLYFIIMRRGLGVTLILLVLALTCVFAYTATLITLPEETAKLLPDDTNWGQVNTAVSKMDIDADQFSGYSTSTGDYTGALDVARTNNPTKSPTAPTTATPTHSPTLTTINPTPRPTEPPTSPIPTQSPTQTTTNPTLVPTTQPTLIPSQPPTLSPADGPTSSPSVTPSINPSIPPTVQPSISPSGVTISPTKNPSTIPTKSPTKSPTVVPTQNPLLPQSPTLMPTLPTTIPTTTMPTTTPTAVPTTPTSVPTVMPTQIPTMLPTTHDPTVSPTTRSPTKSPSMIPSSPPTTSMPSSQPTTLQPTTLQPTPVPSSNPSISPSKSPTLQPTLEPTSNTSSPSLTPTYTPTQMPTYAQPLAPNYECVNEDTLLEQVATGDTLRCSIDSLKDKNGSDTYLDPEHIAFVFEGGGLYGDNDITGCSVSNNASIFYNQYAYNSTNGWPVKWCYDSVSTSAAPLNTLDFDIIAPFAIPNPGWFRLSLWLYFDGKWNQITNKDGNDWYNYTIVTGYTAAAETLSVDESITIYLLFGTQDVSEFITDCDGEITSGTLTLDSSFNIYDPISQRRWIELCQELNKINDVIMYRKDEFQELCFPYYFNEYLINSTVGPKHGMPITNKTQFNQYISSFVQVSSSTDFGKFSAKQYDPRNFNGWFGTKNKDAVWFNNNATIRWIQQIVRTQINKKWGGAAMYEYYKKWEDFITKFNANSPRSFQGIQTSGAYIRMEVEVAFLDGFVKSVLYTIILCAIVMIFFTQNLYLVLLVCLYILIICIWVVGLFGAVGWPFGIIEIISVPTVVGLTIDYALHITHAYIHSPFPDRLRRAKSAVNDLGSSVFASAMTTISSMLILYFATIVIFSDLGWVVGSTTSFGVALALFVCPPCLMYTGPEYDQCHFTWCCPATMNGIKIGKHRFCSNEWHGKKGIPKEHNKAIELEVRNQNNGKNIDGNKNNIYNQEEGTGGGGGDNVNQQPGSPGQQPNDINTKELDDNLDDNDEEEEEEDDLPDGWRAVLTDDGKVYYQNDITKKTQWSKPVNIIPDAPQPPSIPNNDPNVIRVPPLSTSPRQSEPDPNINDNDIAEELPSSYQPPSVNVNEAQQQAQFARGVNEIEANSDNEENEQNEMNEELPYVLPQQISIHQTDNGLAEADAATPLVTKGGNDDNNDDDNKTYEKILAEQANIMEEIQNKSNILLDDDDDDNDNKENEYVPPAPAAPQSAEEMDKNHELMKQKMMTPGDENVNNNNNIDDDNNNNDSDDIGLVEDDDENVELEQSISLDYDPSGNGEVV